MEPGRFSAVPTRGDNISLGEKKFIFADVTGVGYYTIIYSSEDGGDIDPRLSPVEGLHYQLPFVLISPN